VTTKGGEPTRRSRETSGGREKTTSKFQKAVKGGKKTDDFREFAAHFGREKRGTPTTNLGRKDKRKGQTRELRSGNGHRIEKRDSLIKKKNDWEKHLMDDTKGKRGGKTYGKKGIEEGKRGGARGRIVEGSKESKNYLTQPVCRRGCERKGER